MSKNDMFECDLYALITTFEISAEKVQELAKNFNTDKLYYL